MQTQFAIQIKLGNGTMKTLETIYADRESAAKEANRMIEENRWIAIVVPVEASDYTDDWTDALGIDTATLERARRVAVQAAEAIYATDSTDLSRSLMIVGYCNDLDELMADTLRLADFDHNGICQRSFSCL